MERNERVVWSEGEEEEKEEKEKEEEEEEEEVRKGDRVDQDKVKTLK